MIFDAWSPADNLVIARDQVLEGLMFQKTLPQAQQHDMETNIKRNVIDRVGCREADYLSAHITNQCASPDDGDECGAAPESFANIKAFHMAQSDGTIEGEGAS